MRINRFRIGFYLYFVGYGIHVHGFLHLSFFERDSADFYRRVAHKNALVAFGNGERETFYSAFRFEAHIRRHVFFRAFRAERMGKILRDKLPVTGNRHYPKREVSLYSVRSRRRINSVYGNAARIVDNLRYRHSRLVRIGKRNGVVRQRSYVFDNAFFRFAVYPRVTSVKEGNFLRFHEPPGNLHGRSGFGGT